MLLTLARRTLRTRDLWIFGVSASSPLTVLVGAVTAAYASTGVIGVPLSFLTIMVALALLAVGYVAMARHVPHTAPFYGLVARGSGGTPALGGAALALLGYNCIQISLYGLVGVTLAGLLGGTWWAWSAVVWAAVAVLGVTRVTTNAYLIGGFLLVELAVITLFDVAAFMHPAEGLTAVPLSPSALLVDGAGGVLALAVAAFIGFETGPAYAEEARSPRVVKVATVAAVLFLGVFYTMSAWAVALAAGPSRVVDAARDPQSGLPFGLLSVTYGPEISVLASMLLVTSIVAAMAAFHHAVARYIFGMAREQALPAVFARLSRGRTGGTPLAGSVAQSVVAALVVAGFAVAGADPMAVLFTWLSVIGAMAILAVLICTNLAVLRFFHRGGGGREGWATRVGAPVAGCVAGLAVLTVMVGNQSALLGLSAASPWQWLAVVVVAVAGLAGLAAGVVLRWRRPHVHARLGAGTPNPITTRDHRLAELEV